MYIRQMSIYLILIALAALLIISSAAEADNSQLNDSAVLLKAFEQGLNLSLINITIPSNASLKQANLAEMMENAVPWSDTSAKYLGKIIENAEIKSGEGNSINILIVNIHNLNINNVIGNGFSSVTPEENATGNKTAI